MDSQYAVSETPCCCLRLSQPFYLHLSTVAPQISVAVTVPVACKLQVDELLMRLEKEGACIS